MNFDKIDKIINKINYIIIYVLILLLPISTILSFYSDYFEFLKNFKYNLYDILYLIIPIEIFIYTYNIIRKKTKITIFDILLYLLIILGIISLSFSIDYQTSLWGAYLRNEGFLSIFSYYLLFLNSKDIVTKEQTKKNNKTIYDSWNNAICLVNIASICKGTISNRNTRRYKIYGTWF